MTARYVIAKHMSGKQIYHIGVILWADGFVFSRFLGEDGEIPSFVKNKDRFESSLEFWQRTITQDEVEFLGPGNTAEGNTCSRDSSDFLDALKTFKERDYWLAGGGFLLSNITKDNVDEVLSQLFVTVVSKNADPSGGKDGSNTN